MPMSSATAETPGVVRSLVPARMDRLPWARFHWTIVVGLGAAWILDGLEIQIVSAIGSTLQDKGTLGLSSGQVGLLGSVYLFGEVVGALVFGRLTDKLGRKRLFILTLALYLIDRRSTVARRCPRAAAVVVPPAPRAPRRPPEGTCSRRRRRIVRRRLLRGPGAGIQ